jgi:hypothetical protein
MKNIFFHIVLTSILCLVSPMAWAQFSEEITVPLTKPNEPGVLDVGLLSGSITVVGYKGKEVIVKGTSAGRRERNREEADAKAEGLRRIPTNNFGFNVKEVNNVVKIGSDVLQGTLDLEIQVPQRFSVKLKTLNNGIITVRNVEGELEVSNLNGDVLLEEVSGFAVASSLNGKVTARFVRINTEQPMAFSTLNGDVDVTLPGNMKFTPKLRTDRGDIFTDFDFAPQANAPVKEQTRQGVYKVKMEDWVTGKVNGGGPEIMIKNMNGNIYLRKRK